MIIVHIVEPFASGVAEFVKLLTQAMPNDVHIIVHGERKKILSASLVKKTFPSNVRFIKWRFAKRSIDPIMDFVALTELSKTLRRLKSKNLVDAVHLHSSKSGLLGRAACRMAGIKNVIYTPNGASFLAARNKFTRFFYEQLEKFGQRLGGRVVCCSASELEEFLKLGIEAGYINNGVAPSDRGLEVNNNNGKFRIVTSGRIEPQKNPALFNAIASYFENMDQIEFMWIGDGDNKKQLTSRNILITGWVDNAQAMDLVSSCDIYLSTSKYEGLSFAVLEALARKKPVLLSNCTGNKDMVKKGINGSLFNSGADAIVKILQYYNNKEMLPVMGGFSEDICKVEFNVNHNLKRYRDLYAGVTTDAGKIAKWSFV